MAPNPGDALGSFGNFLTPRLATGGAIQAFDIAALQRAGVTAIIDCREDFDDLQLLATGGFNYLWNGMPDDGQSKPPEWFARSLSFALPLLAQPHHRLYVHCAAGCNRGPSMAFAILRAFGVSFDQAMQIVKTGRPQAQVAYAADADKAVGVLGYA